MEQQLLNQTLSNNAKKNQEFELQKMCQDTPQVENEILSKLVLGGAGSHVDPCIEKKKD